MNRHELRRLTALILSLALGLTTFSAFAEGTQREELVQSMVQNLQNILSTNDNIINMYSDYTEKDASATLPSSFDLRDTGVVPVIRNQGNWGTCWGFATIAASEISILSALGLTTDEYHLLYGEDMDLSEKHLAWFAVSHLPELGDYAEGEYPYLASQAGEGYYQANEASEGFVARYNAGGCMFYASSAFANGMGPVTEEMIPYQANDGTASTASDWSLGEEDRFVVYYELLESSMLPSPSTRDENGNYLYNASATQAIKRELLAGRGVTIAYHADHAMDPEAQTNMALDALKVLGFTDEELETVKHYLAGEYKNFSELPDEQLKTVLKVLIVGFGGRMPEAGELDPIIESFRNQAASTEDQQTAMTALLMMIAQFAPTQAAASAAQETISAENSASSEETAKEDPETLIKEALAKIGVSYEEYASYIEKRTEAEKISYLNTETYAQYTDTVYAPCSHAVCIVGWDDTYSADNFLADHRPPADGAWIVRNSWGESYGNDGYFYLSYYDQTLTLPETYRYVTDSDGNDTSEMSILAYDFLPADSVSNICSDTPVYSANIFANDEGSDQVISYVSLLTSEHNVTTTVNVYLLEEDAQNPEDGVLLDTVTTTFEYAGYHRVNLHQNYVVEEGQKLGIVQTQRLEREGSVVYLTPYTSAPTKAFMELQNTYESNQNYQMDNWAEARVNAGESFVYADGQWIDWTEILSDLEASSVLATYYCVDNIAIKAYLYPLAELKELHSLERTYSYFGVNAHICDECGYTLIDYGE